MKLGSAEVVKGALIEPAGSEPGPAGTGPHRVGFLAEGRHALSEALPMEGDAPQWGRLLLDRLLAPGAPNQGPPGPERRAGREARQCPELETVRSTPLTR